jgi:hypothetical protein
VPFVWSRSNGLQNISPSNLSGPGVAISGNGKVAGYVDPCACQLVGFWWSQSTGGHELVVPGQSAGMASGINNSGEVVGTYLVSSTGPQKGYILTIWDA